MVMSEMRGWLNTGELIKGVNISRILEIRFLAVRKENYKYGKGK